jgi:hypothetical protein
MPAGTKLATYHTIEDGIPLDYYLVEEHMGKILKFWVKI